jgi:hypothetical protein
MHFQKNVLLDAGIVGGKIEVLLLEVVKYEEDRRSGKGPLQGDLQAHLEGRAAIVQYLPGLRIFQLVIDHPEEFYLVNPSHPDEAQVAAHPLAETHRHAALAQPAHAVQQDASA